MIKRAGIIPIIIALASAGGLAAQAGPGVRDAAPTRTIFEGATVIDGTGNGARAGMAIVVDGEAIAAVMPVGDGNEAGDGGKGRDAVGYEGGSGWNPKRNQGWEWAFCMWSERIGAL